MNELYRLILDNAPLSQLAAELHSSQQVGVNILDPLGNAIAVEGDLNSEAVRTYPLEWNGALAGYLRLYGESVPEMPEYLLRALAAGIHRQTGREHSLEARLWDALRNGVANSEQSPTDNWNTDGNYLLFYSDANELEEESWPDFFAGLTAVRPYGIAAAAFYDGTAAVIFRLSCCERAALFDALSGVLQEYGVLGALTQPFDGFRLPRQLELAKLTILAGNRLYPNRLLFESEGLASFVFFLVAQRNMKLSNYHNEDVLQVIHNDYEKGSDLSRSLYVWLFYFMDLKAAAREVQIHRNTLDYQIKKIGQQLGHLPDTHKRFEMMCTYGMLAMEQPE